MLREKIEKIVKNGYNLSASEVLKSAAGTVFNKVLLYSILFYMIYFVLTLFLQYIIYKIAGFDVFDFLRSYMDIISSGNVEQIKPFLQQENPNSVWLTLSGFGVYTLISPLLIGFIEMIKNADIGNPYSVSDLFKPYASPKVFGIMIIALIVLLLSMVGTVFCVLPGIYFWVALSIAPLIYWFNEDVSFGESLSGSIKVINLNFWNVLGTIILLILIELSGLLFCGIGVFVTAPIYYAGIYFIYKAIFISSEQNQDIDHNDAE